MAQIGLEQSMKFRSRIDHLAVEQD